MSRRPLRASFGRVEREMTDFGVRKRGFAGDGDAGDRSKGMRPGRSLRTGPRDRRVSRNDRRKREDASALSFEAIEHAAEAPRMDGDGGILARSSIGALARVVAFRSAVDFGADLRVERSDGLGTLGAPFVDRHPRR